MRKTPYLPIPFSLLFKTLSVFLFSAFILSITHTANAQWVRKADEINKRAECINVLYQNKLYMFGGFGDNPIIEKTNEVYDISGNKWSKIASFPAGKEVTHQGAVLVDDNVWLIGGRAIDAHGPASSQVIIYNITTNTWSNGPELIDPATGKAFPIGAGGYILLGRTIHVFGGFGPTMCDDQANLHLTIDVDKYLADVNHVTWENKLAPMPIPRNHISYVTIAGKFYVFGGQFKHDCGALDQMYCHVYDSATDKWTRLTDLPKPRSHAEAATFALDGKIFLAGGQGYQNLTQNTTYIFSPKDNNGLGSWLNSTAYKLPGSFLGLSAKLANKSFIIANGALDSYGNERKETYIATVPRSTAKTLGFTETCIAADVDSGNVSAGHNLLYCIEDESPYTITSNATWLTVTKNATGTVTLNGKDIEVHINTTGLLPGHYTGNITAINNTAGSSASFCVNLNVRSSDGYALTITSKGNGTIRKSPDQNIYNADSLVTIDAVPAPGWKFKGWSGDTTDTANPLSIIMKGNRSIIANFIEDAVPGALITNVAATTGRSYQVANLNSGVVYYTDRVYKITTVPPILSNTLLIKTPNDDKLITSATVLSFNLSQAATVYVAYDPRGTTLPAWLAGWQKLPEKLILDDPKLNSFNIYSKDFPAGKVTIGGNKASPAAGTLCEYVVLVKGLHVSSPDEYALTITTEGNGTTIKSPDQNLYKADSLVKIDAIPALGWKFNGWFGDTTDAVNPLSIVMNRNRSVVATFIEDVVPDTLITDVAATTENSYQVAELNSEVVYYTDREYKITTVPSILSKALFIKTPNDDKLVTSATILSFNLSQDATVYVAYDPRATTLPAWLAGWEKLPEKLGLDDPKLNSFNIYSKNFPAGKVSIGGNKASPAAGSLCEYIVLAKAFTALNKSTMSIYERPSSLDTAIINDSLKTANKKIKSPTLSPNPVKDHFKVVFANEYAGIDNVQIVDFNGKIHNISKSDIKTEASTVNINVAPLLLRAGLYSVVLTLNKGKTYIIKFIVE